LEARPDRVAAEPRPLDEERLAHRAIVSIEAVGQAEQPNVEDLLVGIQRREQIIDHFVEEAKEQRFIQVVLQAENL
jgi:hypothetical protein